MKQHFFALFAAHLIVCALSHSAMATYHVEVSSAPGINMFLLKVWGDADEPGQLIGIAAGQMSFDFSSSSLSATDVTVQSVVGQSGFNVASGPAPGTDFSALRTFGILDGLFGGGVILPSNANSAADALPFLKVTYNSNGSDLFGATVLPSSGGSQGTTVNGQTNVLGGSTMLSAVPEPSSFILVGLVGGIGYGCVWLRRRRAQRVSD